MCEILPEPESEQSAEPFVMILLQCEITEARGRNEGDIVRGEKCKRALAERAE